MNKTLSVLVSLTEVLADNECTYNQTDEIVELMRGWLKQSREDIEYDTVHDYMKQVKSRSADNLTIRPLNHVAPYF